MIPQSRRPLPRWPAAAAFLVPLGLAVALRLAWLVATNHTFEDAFITFQFSKRLAAGEGFVYNSGEPIYGTTTPLFTLLLAGWLKAFPGHVVAGARLLDLAAGTVGLALTWFLLARIGIATAGRVCALTLLALSNKLWLHDTEGMETPLLLCLMMASGYALQLGWPVRAGIAAGLLLWTRIDLAIWPVALAIGTFWVTRRVPWRFLLTTGLSYLPWILFATVSFGSPVPHTITAKWFAYNWDRGLPTTLDARILLSSMSPVASPQLATIGRVGLVSVTLLAAGWGAVQARKHLALLTLPVFALLEATRILLSRATFERRYFVPVLSTILILAGVGLGALHTALRARPAWGRFSVVAGISASISLILLGATLVPFRRDIQVYRHEGSLMEAGKWLNTHSPSNATVFLEPLGYAGYFADRRMIDAIGLISPQVVELRKRLGNVSESRMISLLRPDYFLMHCDDALRETAGADPEDNFTRHYSRRATFNPLGFDPRESKARTVQRLSCYEIWGRIENRASDAGQKENRRVLGSVDVSYHSTRELPCPTTGSTTRSISSSTVPPRRAPAIRAAAPSTARAI